MPDRLPETDNEILALFQIDSEGAWRMIYDRCHSTAMWFMRSQFRSGIDFEDVFQEACIILYNRMQEPGFVLTCSMQTFINAVCRNTLFRQHRRRPNQTSIDPEFELDLAIELGIDEEEHSVRYSVFLDVIAIMQTSANRCYEILHLVFFDNIGMEQIADRLGYTSAANVRNQKYRCLVNARREIERRLNLNSSRS